MSFLSKNRVLLTQAAILMVALCVGTFSTFLFMGVLERSSSHGNRPTVPHKTHCFKLIRGPFDSYSAVYLKL